LGQLSSVELCRYKHPLNGTVAAAASDDDDDDDTKRICIAISFFSVSAQFNSFCTNTIFKATQFRHFCEHYNKT